MLCSIWAALLQLAAVHRLATKVRGEAQKEEVATGSTGASAGDPWVKQRDLKGTACRTGQHRKAWGFG